MHLALPLTWASLPLRAGLRLGGAPPRVHHQQDQGRQGGRGRAALLPARPRPADHSLAGWHRLQYLVAREGLGFHEYGLFTQADAREQHVELVQEVGGAGRGGAGRGGAGRLCARHLRAPAPPTPHPPTLTACSLRCPPPPCRSSSSGSTASGPPCTAAWVRCVRLLCLLLHQPARPPAHTLQPLPRPADDGALDLDGLATDSPLEACSFLGKLREPKYELNSKSWSRKSDVEMRVRGGGGGGGGGGGARCRPTARPSVDGSAVERSAPPPRPRPCPQVPLMATTRVVQRLVHVERLKRFEVEARLAEAEAQLAALQAGAGGDAAEEEEQAQEPADEAKTRADTPGTRAKKAVEV